MSANAPGDYVHEQPAGADLAAEVRALQDELAGTRASLAETGRMLQHEYADADGLLELLALTQDIQSPTAETLELVTEAEFFAADDTAHERPLGLAATYQGRGVYAESRIFYGSAMSEDRATLTFGRLDVARRPIADLPPHTQLALRQNGVHVRTIDRHGVVMADTPSHRISPSRVLTAMEGLETARDAHESPMSRPASGTRMRNQVRLLRDRLQAA